MPLLLALEWDAKEARVAVARARGKEVTIEHAFAVSLAGSEGGAGTGAMIAAALKQRGIGRTDALVSVGRANIELRQLSLPPSPPEEMPELVRFQALRQFTTIGEEWPIDFVPLAAASTEASSVLAAAISPDLVTQIRATCQGAELTPKRMILRPFAAASLLRRHDRDTEQPCRLMVDLLAEEADLTVLDGPDVLLMRTVRIPVTENPEAQGKPLLGEIRRTIAAASNQLHGRRVERVILCGEGTDQAAIRALVEKELSLDVDLFSPFDELNLSSELQNNRPAHSGRFAPLLGMLMDEATGAPHAIDFLHPRRKPEPVNTRRRNLLIAATVATMGLAAGLLTMMQLNAMDDEAQQLRARISGLKGKVLVAQKQQADTAAVQDFLDGSFNWLEELQRLSERMPSAEKVIVTQLVAESKGKAGGQIDIDGFVRGPEQIREVQDALRFRNRKVLSRGGQEDARAEKSQYRWRFDETVVIPAGEPDTTADDASSAAGRSATASPVRSTGSAQE